MTVPAQEIGERYDHENNRPINHTPNVSRIIKLLIKDNLWPMFWNTNLLTLDNIACLVGNPALVAWLTVWNL